MLIQGHKIVLTFVPTFPEAEGKSDSPPPRITMIGSVAGEKVEFDRVEIEDENGQYAREPKDAKMIYQAWLDFIEDNY